MKLIRKIKDWFLAEDINSDLGANILVSIVRIMFVVCFVGGALIAAIMILIIK